MSLPLFLAKRMHGDNGDRRKVSKPAMRIATAGVAIGLAVMVVTVAVVLGFKHTIRDKVIGFGSHIQVENFMAQRTSDPYPICIDDSVMKVLKGIDGVKHVQRYAIAQGILKTDSDYLGISFKGIGPEYDPQFIKSNLVEGSMPAFSDSKSQQKLLISKSTADKLRLKTGDKIFAYFVSQDDVRLRRFTICGVYQTNMAQFDNALCFTDIYTTQKLNNWDNGLCSGAELQVDDFQQLDATADNVAQRVNRTSDAYGETFTSQTIYEAYPQVFSWLSLLDINVWIIIALMVCVAGFTMISGLLIIILERTQTIGILKALGATNTTVRHTFLWFAVFVIGKGMVWGDIIGIGLVLLQQQTGLVRLDPATYYVATAPMELNIPLTLLLNAATLAVSLFVLIAPSYLVSRIHPARSMRYE